MRAGKPEPHPLCFLYAYSCNHCYTVVSGRENTEVRDLVEVEGLCQWIRCPRRDAHQLICVERCVTNMAAETGCECSSGGDAHLQIRLSTPLGREPLDQLGEVCLLHLSGAHHLAPQ